MQTKNGRIFLQSNEVNLVLKEILNDYGAMLKSPASLKYVNEEKPDGWLSPVAQLYINFEEV